MVYLFGLATGFLVGVLLARSLAVEGYGLYGSAMAAASLGATAAAGGVQLHATRELAEYQARNDSTGASHILAWSCRVVVILAFIASLVVGSYMILGLGVGHKLVAAGMAATVAMSALLLVGAILRGSGAIVLGQALENAIRPAIYSGLLLFALISPWRLQPWLAMSLASLAILIALLVGLPHARNLWAKGRSSDPPDPKKLNLWRRSSATMGLTSVTRSAEAAIPLILIGSLADFEQAGLYRVAASTMILPAVPTTMLSFMIPAMVAQLFEKKNMRGLEHLSAASCFVMSLPTVLIALVLWSFGKPLLSIIFGEEYAAAWLTLAILTAGSLVVALGGISIAILHTVRREATVTRAFGLSLAISTSLSFLLAPQYGSSGVAISVLAGVTARTGYLTFASIKYAAIDPTIVGALRRRTIL